MINQALYEGPVEDPWFQALDPITAYNTGPTVGTVYDTFYVSALPASPMGCVTRHQWCKDEGNTCTKLTGVAVGGLDASKEAITKELRLNSRQQAILNRLYSYVWSKYKHVLNQSLRTKNASPSMFVHWITSIFVLQGYFASFFRDLCVWSGILTDSRM